MGIRLFTNVVIINCGPMSSFFGQIISNGVKFGAFFGIHPLSQAIFDNHPLTLTVVLLRSVRGVPFGALRDPTCAINRNGLNFLPESRHFICFVTFGEYEIWDKRIVGSVWCKVYDQQ